MAPTRWLRSARPAAWGTYPRRAAASRTAALVASETRGLPESAMEAVAGETPASRATSFSVLRRPGSPPT